MLIEIIVVAALILGGLAMYMSFSGSGSSNTAIERELLDDATSTTPSSTTGRPSPAAPGGGVTPGLVSQPQSIPGRALAKARGTECQNNLRQLRTMVMMAKQESEDGSNPASLGEVGGASEISTCPIGKVHYNYDPATGEVHCPYPGHESF